MHKNCGEFRNCETIGIRDLSYNLRWIRYCCILFLLSGSGTEVTRCGIAGFGPVAAKDASAAGATLRAARASIPSFLWSYLFCNANKTPFSYSFNLQSLFWSYTTECIFYLRSDMVSLGLARTNTCTCRQQKSFRALIWTP